MNDDYQEYIKSSAWKTKREAFIAQHPTKKCFCGKSKSLHVHHATYDRFKNERFEDLRLVCKECHAKIHNFHKNAGVQHTLEQATNTYISMWLAGNKPDEDGITRIYLPYNYKSNKKKKKQANIVQNIQREANRQQRAKTVADIIALKSWEQMSKKEKKKVDFNRYISEKNELLRKSAQGKSWDKLVIAERKAVDPIRYAREKQNHKKIIEHKKQTIKERQKELRRINEIVDAEKKRRANGL